MNFVLFLSTLVAAVLAGAVALVLELAGAHILAPGFGMGLNAWTAMIAVTLCGLSCGYLCGGWAADRWSALAARVLLPATLAFAGVSIFADAYVWQGVVNLCAEIGPRGGALCAALTLFFAPFFFLGAVFPLTLKLWVTAEKAGWRGGLLSAISSLGSLGGALLAGYVLIPQLPLEFILNGCAATLTVVSVGVALCSRSLKVSALFALLIALPVFFPPQPYTADTLCRRNSFFGPLEVVERGGVRLLLVSGTIQGACHKASPDESFFPYVRLLAQALIEHSAHRPKEKVLLVGLGAGFLPRLLDPGACETVDADRTILEAASGFFGFDAARYPVHIADGRAYLLSSQEKYGAIVFDAYGGGSHPWHLLSRESFEIVKRRLQPQGIFVVNFLGFVAGENDEFVRALEATLREVFGEVELFTSLEAGSYANVIFVAHEAGRRINWPEGPYEQRVTFLDGRPARVISDSFNPVAGWNRAIEERWRAESRRMLAALQEE